VRISFHELYAVVEKGGGIEIILFLARERERATTTRRRRNLSWKEKKGFRREGESFPKKRDS